MEINKSLVKSNIWNNLWNKYCIKK